VKYQPEKSTYHLNYTQKLFQYEICVEAVSIYSTSASPFHPLKFFSDCMLKHVKTSIIMSSSKLNLYAKITHKGLYKGRCTHSY